MTFLIEKYLKFNFLLNALVAQWIEQKFPKLLVGGSIPLEGTALKKPGFSSGYDR